jgi:hypothetical protein
MLHQFSGLRRISPTIEQGIFESVSGRNFCNSGNLEIEVLRRIRGIQAWRLLQHHLSALTSKADLMADILDCPLCAK